MTGALSQPDSSVRETERTEASWIEALEHVQYGYESAKESRRQIARHAAQDGVSRRKIATAMGLSVSTVQELVGRTSSIERSSK